MSTSDLKEPIGLQRTYNKQHQHRDNSLEKSFLGLFQKLCSSKYSEHIPKSRASGEKEFKSRWGRLKNERVVKEIMSAAN